ncbi:hypothetical protein [Thermus amyloliquefaciens]|uniref:hypothetical protein n=1 Tax=Thermus amyloliquefaciens TaxID=1449080 RepID=UPI0005701B10|nr:hypothetical protein [Thermus amyloliquefaciens]
MVRPYRFSLEEFLRLPLPERGVELLRGEIYQRAPIGSRHADVVDRGPAGDHYREQLWLSPGENLAPLVFPDLILEVPW